MSRQWLGALVVLLLACAAACVVSGLRAARAESAAHESLSRLRAQRGELDALRAASIGLVAAPEDRSDLSPAITSALRAAGAGPEALGALTQRSDRSLDPAADRAAGPRSSAGGAAGGLGARERVVSVSLRGMGLAALGLFLAEWRSIEPLWIVAAIELAPSPDADGTVSVVIELRRVYVVSANAAGDGR